MTDTIRDEFIGKNFEIVRSTNKQLQGLQGKIVDETRDSFKVLINKKNFKEFKMIFKNGNTFKIGSLTVDGSKIMKRPEDRIKLKG
jgi:ribonuclease P protein subunit POP4